VSGRERNGVSEARKNIGFCPQVDPLLELMTSRETLKLFARLRGIPSDRLDLEINALLDRLTLTSHADKTSEKLSGGNKRKLSLGIALIGNPKVLLIDEPSSGLDPVAKRKGMWKLITEVSRDRSVILTTHSMQEAEALCTRAGIMVDGRLVCIGSVQHLKSKYLDGYTIDIVCHSSEGTDELVPHIMETLPAVELVEGHGRFIRLYYPNLSRTLGLGEALRRLQALAADPVWPIQHYSISQCSLEQVFLQLTSPDRNTGATSENVWGERLEV
jgi:ATP-binding cassette subfamily A (ABC1) protein 3